MISPERIDGLTPRGAGHSFVFYGDSCSGVRGAPHEANLAATNAMVARVEPAPEFVIFAGDEIIGLTNDESHLRDQWRHWLDHEMGWLDQTATPLYHTTSNHTTYNTMSERVFTEVLHHLPRNGPPNQQGLSYFVRRDDLLMVFVNTCSTGLGGEGFVETKWLDEVLAEHADASWKLVIGHHPVHPVNGLSGEHQRELGQEAGRRFWDLLVKHKVDAYLCSHILAFDVQVHDGVLQILSAGAGTAYRMPPETEYLHFVQAAIDGQGLRYQVIDQAGAVREGLAWPPELPPSSTWPPFDGSGEGLIAWRFRGTTASDSPNPAPHGITDRADEPDPSGGAPQTLAAVPGQDSSSLPRLWIGLTGQSQRITVTMAPAQGRSPHYWFGPELGSGTDFDFQLLLHRGMGPGGLLLRTGDDQPWSSLRSASPWGLEALPDLHRWIVGRTADHNTIDQRDASPFRGSDLVASWCIDEEH